MQAIPCRQAGDKPSRYDSGQLKVSLSRTLAPGKHLVNMVDWKYSGFFLVRLDHRAHLPATKFLESGPGLRSNRTIWRLDLFHHVQSKARHSLAKVPPLLRAALSSRQIVRFDRNPGPDSSGLVSMEHAVPSARKKDLGGTRNFHKKSMEILWKSFNNILWTTDDSTIGRINICGDPDSTIGRKKPPKKSPGATRKRPDKVSAGGTYLVHVDSIFPCLPHQPCDH